MQPSLTEMCGCVCVCVCVFNNLSPPAWNLKFHKMLLETEKNTFAPYDNF